MARDNKICPTGNRTYSNHYLKNDVETGTGGRNTSSLHLYYNIFFIGCKLILKNI